jgi:hypothetical protein
MAAFTLAVTALLSMYSPVLSCFGEEVQPGIATAKARAMDEASKSFVRMMRCLRGQYGVMSFRSRSRSCNLRRMP